MTSSKFYQDGPQLANQFTEDLLLQSYLQRHLPDEMYREVAPSLERLGERVVGDIQAMGDNAENNPPTLVQYDPWGRRIDEVRVDPGWDQLKNVAAEEGLIGIGFDREYEHHSRLYQFAKLYLYTPSSAIFTCPLAMTDGAARLIEVYGDEDLKQGAYKYLTSRDPKRFWTSGQWMTERPGGSDVGNSETVARRENGSYRLYGDKWFTSAINSEMAMTLARIEDENGEISAGSRGLSLFYLETKNTDGSLNNILVNRLKDKLGTKALPTAELTLDGARAKLVGEPGRGVKNISVLFNVTRIYNAMSAISLLRRGLALARNYAHRRSAFGKKLSQHDLHLDTLASIEVEFQAAFHLTFYLVGLLGKEECGLAGESEVALLRILTPLAKLYTAKQSIAGASEVVESFGGAGYVEDTGIPRILRDAQVLSIWEGTTNILSLDVLRSMNKENTLPPFIEATEKMLATVSAPELSDSVDRVGKALADIQSYLDRVSSEGTDFLLAGARHFAFSLSRTFSAALLLEHAQWAGEKRDDGRPALVARRWCGQELAPLINPEKEYRDESRALALDEEWKQVMAEKTS